MGYAFALSLVVGLFAALIAMHRWIKRAEKTWTLVDQGFYLSVEYGYDTESRRTGAMAHSTSTVRFDVTVIRFSDGHTHVLRGRHSMPFASGTRMRILRNDLGVVRFEDDRLTP